MSSRRCERLEESIKQEVSKIILYELKDPRIAFVTITKVDITADLKNAKVHISILGDDTTRKKTLQAIEHAKGFIQAKVGAQLQIKYTPVLTFCLDESVQKSLRISKLIDEAVKGNDIAIKGELKE
ncbi:Ribosome-binding factor A [Candidatus Brocadiaceae bacterium B188]|jgi:ribosome-binding factor A|nr:30S ribosome-binding factor RbfA [Candidatus Brocadia sapporoensis]MEB2309208.1 30S ribosome-binding factor RbfA [Candidatus Brocadiaceae bacterium]OQZ02988.1 MAG: ribosome-binding factor A [Candidatus Brocadia sp. UTAMX1]QQR67572.1 MAG: 30S ribosome-binding factor RbfA [Candidatus Brocadia sp.]RZV58976.1 MAG: 30S ribosome-binding factor RbfA [Candidatus Brocadia sp. BROELEC01]TWU52399.1 Ribosome-binding factor A [Candidatus Brocadiaceae bacterium B188]